MFQTQLINFIISNIQYLTYKIWGYQENSASTTWHNVPEPTSTQHNITWCARLWGLIKKIPLKLTIVLVTFKAVHENYYLRIDLFNSNVIHPRIAFPKDNRTRRSDDQYGKWRWFIYNNKKRQQVYSSLVTYMHH